MTSLTPIEHAARLRENAPVEMLRRIKGMLHLHRLRHASPNEDGKALFWIEGDIEEWLIDHGYQKSTERDPLPENEQHRRTVSDLATLIEAQAKEIAALRGELSTAREFWRGQIDEWMTMYREASSECDQLRTQLAEAVRVISQCSEALAWCYEVTEYPADGNTDQDAALRAARDFVEKHGGKP